MYIPKWFTPEELFPPEIACAKIFSIEPNSKATKITQIEFDKRNWRRFDERILMMADQIREDHGPMTGNEGNLEGCGFRLPILTGWEGVNHPYNIKTLSQHVFGRAIDGHPKETSCFEIRKAIIQNRVRYRHITFLEIDIFGKNSGKPWLHADCRNNGGVLQLWSPKRGFVSADEYLKWGDK